MKNKNLIFGILIFALIIILIIILTRKSNCNGEGFSKKKSNLKSDANTGCPTIGRVTKMRETSEKEEKTEGKGVSCSENCICQNWSGGSYYRVNDIVEVSNNKFCEVTEIDKTSCNVPLNSCPDNICTCSNYFENTCVSACRGDNGEDLPGQGRCDKTNQKCGYDNYDNFNKDSPICCDKRIDGIWCSRNVGESCDHNTQCKAGSGSDTYCDNSSRTCTKLKEVGESCGCSRSEDSPGSSPNEEECKNMSCKSGLCLDNKCAANNLPNGKECKINAQCAVGNCHRSWYYDAEKYFCCSDTTFCTGLTGPFGCQIGVNYCDNY